MENSKENSKKIVWYNLAFMAFSTVWGLEMLLMALFISTEFKLFSAGF